MEYIRQEIQKGNVQLAKLNAENKPVPMDYAQLEKKQKTQQKRAQILSKLASLQSDEKKEWVYLKKLRANQLYKSNKVQEAIEAYLQAMLGLDIKQEDKEKQRQENIDYKYPIMLNIATCFYKQKEYLKAVQLCNRIIAEQGGKAFTKAYYKKSCVLIAAHEYDSARKAAIEGLKCLKTVSNDASMKKQDFLGLLTEIEKKTVNEKSMYQKMFRDEDDSDQDEDLMTNGHKRKEQVLYYNDSWWNKLTGLCSRSAQATRSILGSKNKQKDN